MRKFSPSKFINIFSIEQIIYFSCDIFSEKSFFMSLPSLCMNVISLNRLGIFFTKAPLITCLLLDFNKANNVAQWQWVAGCGADAAPYFRIFNPILQGEKFDKEGLYVKKWVPELSKVPNKFIHKPWEMELKYQQAIKTIIGKEYPEPIVIHEKARASALEAFQSLKKK